MKRSCLIRHGWLPAVALCCCLPCLAATVYRTVDANGVVSFSSTKPEGDAPVETLVIDTLAPQPGDAERQRLQAMREIAERMAADRMAREKHRAELRLLQAQAQRRYQAPEQPLPDNTRHYIGYPSGYPRYYTYPARRPWKHGHRPWPEYPPAWPSPHRPRQDHRPGSPSRPLAAINPQR